MLLSVCSDDAGTAATQDEVPTKTLAATSTEPGTPRDAAIRRGYTAERWSLGGLCRSLYRKLLRWSCANITRFAATIKSIAGAELAAWPFADYVFGCHWDVMTHTLKIRQARFHDCVDSEDAFLDLFQQCPGMNVIPRLTLRNDLQIRRVWLIRGELRLR